MVCGGVAFVEKTKLFLGKGLTRAVNEASGGNLVAAVSGGLDGGHVSAASVGAGKSKGHFKGRVFSDPLGIGAKLIIQSGIKRVVYGEKYRIMDGVELLERAGVQVDFMPDQE